MATQAAAKRLWKEYKDISNPRISPVANKQIHVECDDDDIFKWKVALIITNKDSDYHGAYLKGTLKFPLNYPYSPPSFKFTPPIYHPNVYNDGRVCISILHESGNDQSDEPDNECWSPVQSVESVLVSIISLLEDPNISSPANVDAAITFKKHKDEYKKKIEREVVRSRGNVPDDFVWPVDCDEVKEVVQPGEDVEDGWWEDNYYDDDEDEDEDEEEQDDEDEDEDEDEDMDSDEDDDDDE
ncbi:hypothetical protein CANARDRAFT_197056 [[Candida] arabinofermentans NRRL YB-2248]|uniref:UBC core domain-containing protein n=1 Tax=[Candida] arabinofermentans NRRL YB-2248 TaxID=983967 RepID=A0A1E4T3R7_9ASCO|nr:hypothetical protein CANARDRAFT_197056 [[Candida] arabinofermentans NRRL YB-2248]